MTGRIVVFMGLLLASLSVVAQSTGIERDVRNLRLSQQESEKMIMDQFKKINDFLVRIQENYSTYAKHISNLSNKFSELEKENELLKSEIAELKKTIAAEALARKKEMERFAGVVASQTAAVAKTSTEPSPSSSTKTSTGPSPTESNSNKGPVGEGEFYEYTVQKGGTLSAISKAYGVGVNDIKAANRLKGNTIFVGQKLYIPVKDKKNK